MHIALGSGPDNSVVPMTIPAGGKEDSFDCLVFRRCYIKKTHSIALCAALLHLAIVTPVTQTQWRSHCRAGSSTSSMTRMI